MKKLFLILGISFIFTGCTGPTYYQYREGESNHASANAQCKAQANRDTVDRTVTRKTGQNCSPTLYGAVTCEDVFTTDHDWGYIRRFKQSYKGCMYGLGWAPCPEGGMHLSECQ